MTVELLPDVEQLLSNFLRAQAEMHPFFTTGVDSAGTPVVSPPADRVYTDIPKNPTWPLLRITRVGGSPVTNRPLRLDAALVQLEAFGGSKRLAHQILETSRAVIDRRIQGIHPEGVATGATFGPMSYRPDDVFSPAKPRYLCLVTIYTHPYTPPPS